MRTKTISFLFGGAFLLMHHVAGKRGAPPARQLERAVEILPKEEFHDCMEKLVAVINATSSINYDDIVYTNSTGGDIFGKDVLSTDEFYQTTKHIFTRTYCIDAVEYCYDLYISSNHTQRYGSCDWTDMAL